MGSQFVCFMSKPYVRNSDGIDYIRKIGIYEVYLKATEGAGTLRKCPPFFRSRQRVEQYTVTVWSTQTKSHGSPVLSLLCWPGSAVPCAVAGGAVRR